MFSRPHHQKIAHVLQLFDHQLLLNHRCFFGGGTAIALMFDEYRESIDIDFLVSDLDAYRRLRELVTTSGGVANLFKAHASESINFGTVRADQYGIRTTLVVAGQPIKFEIVFEARIKLESPTLDNVVCGVCVLTQLDLAATKLLANSDRWADDAVFNRDVIDLAMMNLSLPLLREAITKAEVAYGASVKKDLLSAIERLEKRQNWLERCMDILDIRLPKAVLWSKVRLLKKVLK